MKNTFFFQGQYHILLLCRWLFLALGQIHIPSEWRLFIDSSNVSLKAVHNSNTYPSASLVHSVHTKELCESMHQLLSLLDYRKHKWHICGDLEAIGLLLGMQPGWTMFCCFLCKWTEPTISFIKTGFKGGILFHI